MPLFARLDGQLSLIQRVRLSSLTSPAASARIIAVAFPGATQKIDTVQAKETIIAPKASALVAVDKRMVAGNAEGIRCRKRGKVRFAVMPIY